MIPNADRHFEVTRRKLVWRLVRKLLRYNDPGGFRTRDLRIKRTLGQSGVIGVTTPYAALVVAALVLTPLALEHSPARDSSLSSHPIAIAHRRGYWSVAPPDPARGAV